MVLAQPRCPWRLPASGESLFASRSKTWRTTWLTRHSFAEKVLRAIKGEKGLVEPSYVYLPGIPGGKEIAAKVKCDFFSVPIELGVSTCCARHSWKHCVLIGTAQRCRKGY